MALHNLCGGQIKWCNRSDEPDRFLPPLEFAGFYYIIAEDNIAVEMTAYQPHVCDPEKIVAFEKAQAAITKARAKREKAGEDLLGLSGVLTGREEYNLTRETVRKQEYDKAMKVPCPRCKAQTGKPCKDLAKAKRNVKEFTKNPHPARVVRAMEKAEKVFGDGING